MGGEHGRRRPRGRFAEAAEHGEIVFNATSGQASLAALELAGAENLAGKVLIDVANALDFSHGRPPSLFVANTDSLGEQIQRAFPAARVVKALNTVDTSVMVTPGALPSPTDIFVAGDDTDAKAVVEGVLGSFAWPAEHVVDLGDLTAARGMEGYTLLWVRCHAGDGDCRVQRVDRRERTLRTVRTVALRRW